MYGLIILVIIFFFAILLFINSKKKKSIVGLIVSFIIILGIIYVFLINNIDEWTISKKDVIADLKNINLELKDNFEIINNKVTGLSERNQETEILVSTKDKLVIIENIEHSSDYKDFKNEKAYLSDTTINPINKEGQIISYSNGDEFHREKYSLMDNYPTRISLTLDRKSNIVSYERIED